MSELEGRVPDEELIGCERLQIDAALQSMAEVFSGTGLSVEIVYQNPADTDPDKWSPEFVEFVSKYSALERYAYGNAPTSTAAEGQLMFTDPLVRRGVGVDGIDSTQRIRSGMIRHIAFRRKDTGQMIAAMTMFENLSPATSILSANQSVASQHPQRPSLIGRKICSHFADAPLLSSVAESALLITLAYLRQLQINEGAGELGITLESQMQTSSQKMIKQLRKIFENNGVGEEKSEEVFIPALGLDAKDWPAIVFLGVTGNVDLTYVERLSGLSRTICERGLPSCSDSKEI